LAEAELDSYVEPLLVSGVDFFLAAETTAELMTALSTVNSA
jgi:hypothetical protein